MKPFILAGLAFLNLVQPAFAETEPSGDASTMTKYAALASIAAPVLVTAAGVSVAAGTPGQVVRIVDGTGQGLSELTASALDAALDSSTAVALDAASALVEPVPSVVTVGIKKRTIPLVVRKDYLELNQKVSPQ